MKITGFSFIRNAQKFDYPIVEAISSILPICDEVVVAVGNSEDETRKMVENISPKIRIIDTIWDDSLREGGHVLAEETNKAFDAIAPDSDWAFYIQGDEVVHEKYLPVIKAAMELHKDDAGVEGLLFNYKHFYGSYNFVADSRKWYRKEVRVVRPDRSIRSYRDAQGFRKDNKKLWVKPIEATVYHYGWVKDPRHQLAKQKEFSKLWHNDKHVEERYGRVESFQYSENESLVPFEGSHPQVMKTRLQRLNWELKLDNQAKKKTPLKQRILYWIEKYTGWRVGEYKNYRVV